MKAMPSVNVSTPKPTAVRPGASSSPCGCGKDHGSGERGCGCGCECQCEESCCQLECLERPRFFCGQLLTDQDLAALVSWTQGRLSRRRYTDGWGVVCGLEVHCHGDGPAVVGVGPGYAVDCCGRDVVVCEPTTIDLACACVEPQDPCGDLAAYARARRAEEEAECGDDRPSRVHVDLAIRYAELGSDPQAALARGACGQVAVCEDTRIAEGFELTWSEGVEGGSPADEALERWVEAWKCCCEVLRIFRGRFGRALEKLADDGDPGYRPNGDYGKGGESHPLGEKIRRWLLGWIDEHPPHQMCWIRDHLCALDADQLLDAKELVPILFALVQDCRNALALAPCPPCSSASGVPLARVCLEAGGEDGCRVVSIDPYPPYRRPQAPDTLPAPPGSVNLAAVLWHRRHDACRWLADLGVPARLPAEPSPLPTTFERLAELCKQLPFARCGEEICLELLDGEPLQGICLGSEARVIGFAPCEERPPAEETRPVKLEVGKNGPVEAMGERMAYDLSVLCSNPNSFPVTVQVVDRLPAPLQYMADTSGVTPVVEDRLVSWRFEVDARGGLDRSWQVAVRIPPLRQTQVVENSLRVAAVGPGGQRLGVEETVPVRTVLLVGGQAVAEPLERDDLTTIKGIAEGRQKTLREAGIETFVQLAAAPEARLRELFPASVKTDQIQGWQKAAVKLAGGGRR